jgi:hypothetical protein
MWSIPRSNGLGIHSSISYILSRSSLGRSKKRKGSTGVGGVGDGAREGAAEGNREETADETTLVAVEDTSEECRRCRRAMAAVVVPLCGFR